MTSFSTSLSLAHAAYIDARCENKIFQHKQLAALHGESTGISDHLASLTGSSSDALQSDARRLLAALPSSSRYEIELELCLKALRDAVATLPVKMSKAIVKEVSLKHVLPGGHGEAKVAAGAGVVVVVGNDARESRCRSRDERRAESSQTHLQAGSCHSSRLSWLQIPRSSS